MRKKYDVSPERFVEVWEKSKSSDEAAEELHMPKSILHARASGYRAQGINLKRMPRKSRRLDVEGLNRLVEKLRTGETSTENEDGGSFRF
jgi:hypothetical protein